MHITDLRRPPPHWMDLGSAVFEGRAAGPDCYPPLNDMQAQRWWLAGFGSSWYEAWQCHDRDPARYPPPLDLAAHLARAWPTAPICWANSTPTAWARNAGAITETG